MTKPTPREVMDAVGGLPDAHALESALVAGGDPNARVERRTALDHAVMLGYEEKVRLLLAHGANPNLHEDPDPADYGRFTTPLIDATRDGTRLGIMQKLLAAGADPNQRDNLGMTALMSAATFGSIGALNLLLASGASATLETNNGQTALHFAMTRDSPDVVRRLIEAGLDPTKRPARGSSPAELAKKRNHVRTLAVLAELSARGS
jgi:ankyrin repeat protein